MDLAINYSPEAAGLIEAGRIQVDRFKCPDWPDVVAAAAAAALPVYVHFPLVAGSGRMESVDWARVRAFLDDTDTPFVNVHLLCQTEDDASSTATNRAKERMLAEVGEVVNRFGAERVIVENVPYYGGGQDMVGNRPLREAVDPATIHRVVNETGCGFLLDISHARISAHYLGLDEREYIQSLPVQRLRELHVTGLAMVDGYPVDHMPMRPDDWPTVTWALERIQAGEWPTPWVVALEYGGIRLRPPWTSDSDAIAADVPRLAALTKAVGVKSG